MKKTAPSTAIIGAETFCRGGNRYILNRHVRIVTVWKGALLPGFDPDYGVQITDDATLRRAGGLQAGDEAEVETCERWQRHVSAGAVDVTALDIFYIPRQQEIFPKPTHDDDPPSE